jgi:hemerythrin-like domain-containing protein
MPSGAGSISPTYPVEVAVRNICDQHQDMARVFAALENHVKSVIVGERGPDFHLVAATLHYFDLFCHRMHHATEDKCLLSAMRQNGAPRDVVEIAIDAHHLGEAQFAAMLPAFDAWRNRLDVPNPKLLHTLTAYTSSERDCIAYEEGVVLPCAVDTLAARDWETIAVGMRTHDDPLFGAIPAAELAPLYFLRSERPVLR